MTPMSKWVAVAHTAYHTGKCPKCKISPEVTACYLYLQRREAIAGAVRGTYSKKLCQELKSRPSIIFIIF